MGDDNLSLLHTSTSNTHRKNIVGFHLREIIVWSMTCWLQTEPTDQSSAVESICGSIWCDRERKLLRAAFSLRTQNPKSRLCTWHDLLDNTEKCTMDTEYHLDVLHTISGQLRRRFLHQIFAFRFCSWTEINGHVLYPFSGLYLLSGTPVE